MTESQIYRVPPSAYARAYLRRHGTIPAIVIALLVATTLVAGFADMRWWLVGLMGIFIVIPMAMSMAWFIATGRRDMAVRLRPQSIEAANDAVTINFYPFEYDDENPVALQNVVITTNQIITSVTGTRYTTLRLKPGEPFDFILIPTDKIPPGTILEQ